MFTLQSQTAFWSPMDQHLNIIKCEHIKCVGVYMADEIYTAGNSVTDTDT